MANIGGAKPFAPLNLLALVEPPPPPRGSGFRGWDSGILRLGSRHAPSNFRDTPPNDSGDAHVRYTKGPRPHFVAIKVPDNGIANAILTRLLNLILLLCTLARYVAFQTGFDAIGG